MKQWGKHQKATYQRGNTKVSPTGVEDILKLINNQKNAN